VLLYVESGLARDGWNDLRDVAATELCHSPALDTDDMMAIEKTHRSEPFAAIARVDTADQPQSFEELESAVNSGET